MNLLGPYFISVNRCIFLFFHIASFQGKSIYVLTERNAVYLGFRKNGKGYQTDSAEDGIIYISKFDKSTGRLEGNFSLTAENYETKDQVFIDGEFKYDAIRL